MSNNIEKQPNGTYRVRVWASRPDDFGKIKTRQKSNIKTIAVAKKIAEKMEDELVENKDYDSLTFNQLNKMYLTNRTEKMSPSTVDTLKRIMPSILSFLGDVKITNINTRVVQSYIDKLSLTKNKHKPDEKLKSGTLQRHYRHIQAVLNWGVGQDYVEINRVRRVEFPNDDEPFEATIIDAETIGNVLAYLKRNFYIIYIPVLLSVTMSPRRGEALGVEWNSIDFENDTLELKKNVIQVGNDIIERSKLKTPKSKRLLSLSEFVKSELLEHKAMCEGIDSPYVCANIFTGTKPSPSYVTKAFHKTMFEVFGIQMRLHDLRHSFNQLGYESNVDELTRSKIMGHTKTNTTNEIYTHFSALKSKDAMNVISNAIKPFFKK